MHPRLSAFLRADPFDAFRVRAHRGPMGGDPRGRHGPHGHPGRGPGERRMFGRGGRGDLARFFAHGDLRLVILHLIAEKPRHGYEIIKAIEERVGGAYSPSPGTVYPTLTLLEELGHVTVTPGRHQAAAHDHAGGASLPGRQPPDSRGDPRPDGGGRGRPGRRSPPSVVRAKEGLKLALQMRLARGPLSAEQAAAITAALEAATAAVERA